MIKLEDINDNFERAKKFIKNTIGINLTLIELVELKKKVELTTNLFIQNKKEILSPDQMIHPDYEASLMFLNKNYGTQIYSIEDKSNFNVLKQKTEDKLGYEYYSEFFKKLQDEMHFP